MKIGRELHLAKWLLKNCKLNVKLDNYVASNPGHVRPGIHCLRMCGSPGFSGELGYYCYNSSCYCRCCNMCKAESSEVYTCSDGLSLDSCLESDR